MNIQLLLVITLLVIIGFSIPESVSAAQKPAKRTCLVLADGYVTEYAWSVYQEGQFPADHPGHDYCIRGLLDYRHRFNKWLTGWNVKRIDLERHKGPLPLKDIDLVILDDVRQVTCDPYETSLVEFVREGGGLLVYAGKWGMGGCPKDIYSVLTDISSFSGTPVGKILPIQISNTPDWDPLGSNPTSNRNPVFKDAALGKGIDTANWRVMALHTGKSNGQVLAELDGKPFISKSHYGKGSVVVYAGDDLGWIRQGFWSVDDGDTNINKYSGTLWKRMAALAVGDTKPIAASPDPATTWQKGPAFAHPDQPMNIQWGGYFYYRFPEMVKEWTKDIVSHSATVYFGAPEEFGKAGVQGWESVGVALNAGGTTEDSATWMVDADGKVMDKMPCYNNPKALELMSKGMSKWAAEVKAKSPWVAYGHMGDETEWGSCYCEYCKAAFRKQFGYEMPLPKNDFSKEYLNQWMDYQLFKNECIGKMYARAGKAAKTEFPGIKMFASLPLVGAMCHGDDLFHTQSGFDLLWDHTYPGTMAIRVGLNAQVLEETAYLQGRPNVPIFDLLQGFDSYDRSPNMPPPEYMREMAWQAIAHGIDSIGWFVYNAYFWTLPGTEAWDECGRLADDVLSPLTPTLYEMHNSKQPIGLLYSYSQEAVDGLKEKMMDKDDPWKGVIRWWSTHATQEAYEVLKYSQVPFNVISEHRMLEGKELPWKVIVIPYVEYLHPKTTAALQSFMAKGGTVYVGSNSTLDLPGIKKLPMSFDTKFTTMWPKDRLKEWNQRRVRNYMISPFLVKAEQMSKLFANYSKDAMVTVDDSEVIYNVREAGTAMYLFFINDHQLNPDSADYRKKRQKYNHFMLMPMEFPTANTTAHIRGNGYLYPLLSKGAPVKLQKAKATALNLKMNGGDGHVYLLLPEKVTGVEFTSEPKRTKTGVEIKAQILDRIGVIKASIPLRIDMTSGKVKQTVYATTKMGTLSWTAPYLKDFPNAPVTVTITDMASGKIVRGKTL